MLINGIEQISHYQKKNPDIYGDEIISNDMDSTKAVSYTHLTLPTILLV